MDTHHRGMAGDEPVRWMQRHDNLGNALQQLEAACQQGSYTDLELAGLVKLFEFTLELTWNTLKDLVSYEGFLAATPRESIRRAFEATILTENETETLLTALTRRNLLSHTYDRERAEEARRWIQTLYTPVFRTVYDRLQERRT